MNKKPVFNFVVEIVPMPPSVLGKAHEVISDVISLARQIEQERGQAGPRRKQS